MKNIFGFLCQAGKRYENENMHNCLLLFIWATFEWPANLPFPEMIPVKGGPFFRGDSLGDTDERPLRRVMLDDFYIAKTETTLAQFDTFVKAAGYRTDAERSGGSYVWTALGWHQKAGVDWRCDEKGARRPAGSGHYPVMHVSWNDAARYCNWLSEKRGFQPVYVFFADSVAADLSADGYRLPTEAEWEYAAAGGQERKPFTFSGSRNLHEVAWYAGNSRRGAHPVGLKKTNALGLFDCNGNVWEWCHDWYSAAYYAQSRDTLNPAGPVRGTMRAVRGGSWSNNPKHCRLSNRSSRFADARDCNLGFRIVRKQQ